LHFEVIEAFADNQLDRFARGFTAAAKSRFCRWNSGVS